MAICSSVHFEFCQFGIVDNFTDISSSYLLLCLFTARGQSAQLICQKYNAGFSGESFDVVDIVVLLYALGDQGWECPIFLITRLPHRYASRLIFRFRPG